MSTIASLLSLINPEARPYSEDVESIQRGRASERANETRLLELADLKRKQAAEQEMLAEIKRNPALAQQLFGGSVLGSLGQAAPGGPGGMPAPAPGPIRQSPLGGGPAQSIPAAPDLSRFAGVSPQGGGPIPPNVMAQVTPTVTPPPGGAPGTPTLATIGPQGQPQGQPQPQQNPLLEMAQRDPRAALMLQEQQIKAFTTQLSMREKTAEAFATTLQGVNSQESYETAVRDLMQWAPQQVARLPKVWSKEAMQPIINSALSAKDKATLDIAALKEQTDLRTQLYKERQAAAGVPKYTEDSTLNVAIDRRMQQAGIPRGTPPTEAILTQAQEDVQQGKVEVSAKQGLGAAQIERTEKPLEGAAGKDAANLKLLRTMTDDIAALRKDAYTGPIVGRTGYLREQAGQMDQQETAFRSTLQNMKDILGRLRSGANIPVPEMANLERLLPDAKDHPEVFQSKMQSFQRALEQQLESITSVGTTGRQQLREETKPTTPRVGEKSTSQAPASTGKPVGQMSAEETRAEIAAIKKRGGS